MSRSKKDLRKRRKVRIRKGLVGTSDRPRLTVFKSLKYLYAQVIDDSKGHTLVSASSLDMKAGGANLNAAKAVGELIAERAKAKKIDEVVFDRNGYLYHGVIKQLADAARESGLKF